MATILNEESDVNNERPQPSARALSMSVSEEETLLDQLIADCWEQGCWLPGSILSQSLSASAQVALFAVCEQRAPMHREAHHTSVPNMRDQDEQEPDDDIWLVVSQRCDIINSLKREPVVTLIRAMKMPNREAKQKTYRSPNFYTVRTGENHSWVADFRQMITIPKFVLTEYTARQCLPNGDMCRRDFALNLAQKTWRRPVPHEINQAITMPLIEKRKDNAWKWFFAGVGAFLVTDDSHSGSYVLYAVSDNPTGVDPDGMERFFTLVVIPHLNRNTLVLDEERSQVVAAEAVNLPLEFSSYKLDLDYLSSEPTDAQPNF